ncbi:MAG: glycoside hydrolase family 9 protein [Deltaproteobacteria bacterium]|nr:glycoside hydrolase family 9 protein [Deltaproteobacteria bacterium]
MPAILACLLLACAGCHSGTVDGTDAGSGAGSDAGVDAGQDAGSDAGSDAGTDAGSDAGTDAGSDAGTDAGGDDETPLAISGLIRVDHLGWRPADPKIALVLGRAGETIELRRAADHGLAGSFAAGGLSPDEDSGDQLARVDFSAHAAPGDYYLALPSAGARSYGFRIAEDVYAIAAAAAVKSFYYQRCNHDHALPYASDALGGFAGLGGQWVDGACHLGDFAAPAGPGSADHGPLDVHGGWHDAGDYQKTLWGRGVPQMLWAYELHPGAWPDGQLHIPESGNGVPDLLDELRWELDFYLRMQRPDGHFMSSVKGRGDTVVSPPSLSDQGRVYFDCQSPSGDGWSGGGVTLVTATGNAVLSLAHAAQVFRAAGQTAIGDGYAAAALAGWTWLEGQDPADDAERRLRAAAAAAVYRLDPGQSTARDAAEALPWSDWDGLAPWSVTPAEAVISAGAWHYLANPAASQEVKDAIAEGVELAIVERAFAEQGAYGGMYGGPGNGWSWSWGSNRAQGLYGSNLLMAAHFGVLGAHSEAELRELAQRYLHYLLGLNPLNMVYMTNMAAYGGEHSSFQLYHGWFSYTGADGDHGNADYNGKPASVDEPLYPYYPNDDAVSAYGPAPGLVPGGPNYGYSGAYEIPNREYPAYAYRDFSVGCDWDGSACRAASWEITEPMAAYQGPVVLLMSFFVPGG